MKAWSNSDSWSYWQCWECGVESFYPDTISETSCGNGHKNWLGLASETQHRRAYKSAKDRAKDLRAKKAICEMFHDAFNAGKKP